MFKFDEEIARMDTRIYRYDVLFSDTEGKTHCFHNLSKEEVESFGGEKSWPDEFMVRCGYRNPGCSAMVYDLITDEVTCYLNVNFR